MAKKGIFTIKSVSTINKREKEEVRNGYSLERLKEDFLRNKKNSGLTEATLVGYERYIKDFLSFLPEGAMCEDLNYRVIDEFVEHKLTSAKMVSVATQLRHLRAWINFGKKRGHIDRDFQIEIPKFETEQKEPYTMEEMGLLLKRPTGESFREWRSWAMVNFFYGTGMRLSTVTAIKISDISFTENTVRLEHNKDRIKKTMPLSSGVMKIVKEWIDLVGLSEADYLFPEYEGGMLSKNGAIDSIAKYNKERGVYKTSIHLFRHTFAKDYILNGGNPAKLQRLLNHKTIDMTMRYVNLYANDISSDLDVFNPLDTYKAKTRSITSRKTKI